MSEQNLYPVFDLEDLDEPTEAEEEQYLPSILFDFDKGDFVLNAKGNLVLSDGQTAYKQWCTKMSLTEMGSCLSYDFDDGLDMEGIRQQDNREAAESELERAITQALSNDPRTDFVGNFQFEWNSDEVHVSSEVHGKDWDMQEPGTIGPLVYSLDI